MPSSKRRASDSAHQPRAKPRLRRYINKGYEVTLENSFDRKEEEAADKVGLIVANKSGYTPTGLAQFLTKLADRNKGLKERSGVFASHPETMGRIETIKKVISAEKLDGDGRRRGPLHVDDHVQAGAGGPGRAGRAAKLFVRREARGAEVERRRQVRSQRGEPAGERELQQLHRRLCRLPRRQSRSRCPRWPQQGASWSCRSAPPSWRNSARGSVRTLLNGVGPTPRREPRRFAARVSANYASRVCNWLRLWTPTLSKIRVRCFLVVPAAMPSVAAMSALR